jgi:hypothetical protein
LVDFRNSLQENRCRNSVQIAYCNLMNGALTLGMILYTLWITRPERDNYEFRLKKTIAWFMHEKMTSKTEWQIICKKTRCLRCILVVFYGSLNRVSQRGGNGRMEPRVGQ